MPTTRSKAGIAWTLVAAAALAPGCSTGRHRPLNYWEDAGTTAATVAKGTGGQMPYQEAYYRNGEGRTEAWDSGNPEDTPSTWEKVGKVVLVIIFVVVLSALRAIAH